MTVEADSRLRRATLDDVPRLKELGVLGWETTYHDFVSANNRAGYLAGPFWSLERLAAIVSDPTCLALVIETNPGEVGGFLTMEPVGDGVIELSRFYVDPSLRGTGFGTTLFNAGRDWAMSQGGGSMLVNVFADNHGGRRFYERAGCVLIRLEPYAIGDQIVGDAWYALDLDFSGTVERKPD